MIDDRTIERYARQIVIAGIGAAGQERLLGTDVVVLGNGRGVRQAVLYLEAAGLRRVNLERREDIGAALAADLRLGDPEFSALAELGVPMVWYALGRTGFLCGLYPETSPPRGCEPPANDDPAAAGALHDAAAAAAAAALCAIVAGLDVRRDVLIWEP